MTAEDQTVRTIKMVRIARPDNGFSGNEVIRMSVQVGDVQPGDVVEKPPEFVEFVPIRDANGKILGLK